MLRFAAVLIKQGDTFLFQHRDLIPDIDNPGKYDIWGGTQNEDETPLECAVRELEDETGVTAPKTDLVELVSYQTRSRNKKTYGDEVGATLYYYEVPDSVKVECYEGQGIIRVQGIENASKDMWADSLERAYRAYEKMMTARE